MTKQNNIIKQIASPCISLCLVVCIVFSSLSAYSSELYFNENTSETSFSLAQFNQDYIHHTNASKTEFLAEIFDAEEEEDDFYGKKKTTLLSVFLRTLWSYSIVESDNLFAVEYAETPILKIAEPCYIEYCSLKIPS